MSVVVLGMNAPKSCYGCDLARFLSTKEPYCIRTMKVVGPPGKRPNWCPLHPLPEKHGRLIDADELVRLLGDWGRTTSNEFVNNMPTIVEAEGD